MAHGKVEHKFVDEIQVNRHSKTVQICVSEVAFKYISLSLRPTRHVFRRFIAIRNFKDKKFYLLKGIFEKKIVISLKEKKERKVQRNLFLSVCLIKMIGDKN